MRDDVQQLTAGRSHHLPAMAAPERVPPPGAVDPLPPGAREQVAVAVAEANARPAEIVNHPRDPSTAGSVRVGIEPGLLGGVESVPVSKPVEKPWPTVTHDGITHVVGPDPNEIPVSQPPPLIETVVDDISAPVETPTIKWLGQEGFAPEPPTPGSVKNWIEQLHTWARRVDVVRWYRKRPLSMMPSHTQYPPGSWPRITAAALEMFYNDDILGDWVVFCLAFESRVWGPDHMARFIFDKLMGVAVGNEVAEGTPST